MRTRTTVHCTYPDRETAEYTLGYPHAGVLALLDPFQDVPSNYQLYRALRPSRERYAEAL